MIRSTKCPDPAQFRRLLGNEVPSDEQSDLVEHLDACPDCQRAVGQFAGPVLQTARLRSLPSPSPLASPASSAAKDGSGSDSVSPTQTPLTRPTGPLKLDFLAPPVSADTLGRLGQFEVLEVLGRGGMGLVLKAFDPALQRLVAIKVLDPQLASDDVSRKRFCREARAAAAVTHENVIAIHQVDIEDNCPLPSMVMQLVTGETLQARLDREGALPLKEVLRIGLQVVAGLAAAHAQGLIHRDVKPDNVLLEESTERVKLTDFGLALALDDVRLTQNGLVAGTPLYMAPEQARGEAIDHRADLFSFGSLLYAACTGKPPFQGSTPYVLLRQITEDQPRPIREVNPAVPEWLAAVIDKLHAKAPADRFQTAAEVAEVLAQHLALLTPPTAVPVAIVPVPRVELPRRRAALPRWVRAVVVAAVVLLLLLGGFVSFQMAGWVGSPGTSAPGGRLVLQGNAGPVWAIALSPDGTELAAALDDGTVKLCDLSAGRVTLTLNASMGPVWSLAYAAAGGVLATGGEDGTVKLWDAATKKEARSLAHTGPVRALVFSPDGQRLAAGCSDGSVSVWNVAGQGEPLAIKAQRGLVAGLAFTPDGQTLASAGDKTVKLWDAKSGQERLTLQGHAGAVYAVRFSPDGRTVATGGWDKTIKIWDAGTGQNLTTLAGHSQDVLTLALTPDGKILASGGEDRTIKLWDVATGKELTVFSGHTGAVYTMAFSGDGRTLVTGGRDGTVRSWDVPATR